MELNRAVLVGLDGTGNGRGVFDAAGAADVFVDDRPDDMEIEEYERRMKRLITDLPSRQEGREILQEYVTDNLASLTQLRSLLELREKQEQADAIGVAEATVTVEGERRSRNAATATRLSHASYRMFFLMQAE